MIIRIAEQHGERATDGGHHKQTSFHDHETILADRISGADVINEQPRQIEQPGEPGDEKNHVEGF